MNRFLRKINFESKYSHLLFVLVMIFLMFPFLEDVKTEISLISFLCFFVVIFSLRALQISMRILTAFVIFGTLALLFDVLFWLNSNLLFKHVALYLSLLLYVFFLSANIILMMKNVFSSTKVTKDTILAGINIYLLIGFLWTLLYHLVMLSDPNAFYFSEPRNAVYLMYYSFTTLTTVGYGDIFPVNKFAMIFSNMEAIIGQLYISVFIARLVGMHIINQHRD